MIKMQIAILQLFLSNDQLKTRRFCIKWDTSSSLKPFLQRFSSWDTDLTLPISNCQHPACHRRLLIFSFFQIWNQMNTLSHTITNPTMFLFPFPEDDDDGFLTRSRLPFPFALSPPSLILSFPFPIITKKGTTKNEHLN